MSVLTGFEEVVGKSSKFVGSTVVWIRSRLPAMSEEGRVELTRRLNELSALHEKQLLEVQLKNLFGPESVRWNTCLGGPYQAKLWMELSEELTTHPH